MSGSKYGAPHRVSTLISPTDRSQPCPTQPLPPPESYSNERSGAMPRPLGINSGYDRWAPPSLLASGGSTSASPSVGSGNWSPSIEPSPICAGVSCGSRASVVPAAPPSGTAIDAVDTRLVANASPTARGASAGGTTGLSP